MSVTTVATVHRGSGVATSLRSLLLRRPESGLPTLRWLLGLFAAGTCAVLAVVAAGLGRPATAAAALAIVVLRVLDMRRGRVGHVALDPVEGLLLVIVLAGLGIDASSPVAYTALYFRAAYVGRGRLIGSVIMCVAALEIGAVLSMSAPFERAAQHVMGLLFTGFIMRIVIMTLLTREREVLAEREFLDAVLESLDVGVVACDTDGRPLHVNRALRQAGLDPRDGTGRPDGPREARVDLGAPVLQPLAQALQGRVVREREVTAQVAGGRRDYVVNAQPVRARGGERLGAVVALHDVTERRQAEEQLSVQALSDPLTGLPNRLLLRDRLDRAAGRGRTRHGMPARAVHRPRRLQDRQRQRSATTPATSCSSPSRAARAVPARRRHPGPARRRRVRDPAATSVAGARRGRRASALLAALARAVRARRRTRCW